MRKVLIFTTREDLSLPLFFTWRIKQSWNINIILYDEQLDSFTESLPDRSDLIYLRDPFTTNIAHSDIAAKLEAITQKSYTSLYIDNIKNYDDISFEDKWNQYLRLKDYMPHTQLLSSESVYDNTKIIKKRIASRGKGLIFNLPTGGDLDIYIIQEKLQIETEYRIFSLRGNIIPQAIRKNTTNGNQIKAIDYVSVPENLMQYVGEIDAHLHMDFLGYDIAQLDDGSYKLIEVNRSPQFKAFHRLVGINLAENLLDSYV